MTTLPESPDASAGSRDGAGRSRNDRRREQILDAAARVFADKSYHEAGIADIAADLGIGHGTFYRYFKNKREIAARAFDLAVQRITEAVLREDPAASDTMPEYQAQMERIFDRIFELLDGHPHLVRFLYRQMIDPAKLSTAMDGFTQFAADFVGNGVRKGFLRADVDSEITGQILVAVIFDLMRRSATAPPPQSERHRWYAAATSLLLDGVRPH